MVDLGLFNFVKNELAAGKTEEEVHQELQRNGDSEQDIAALFDAVKNNNVPQATTEDFGVPEVQALRVGKLRASWMLAKASLAILRKDLALLWFPLLEAFFVAVFGVLFFGSLYSVYIIRSVDVNTLPNWVFWILYFFLYFGGAFIIGFFRIAMMNVIRGVLHPGGDTRFGTAFGVAASRAGTLVGWALMTATVGLVVQLLESQRGKGMFGTAEYVAGKAVETSWRIGSAFSLPAILIDKVGAGESIKKSVAVIRRSWGESVSLYVGTGLVFFVLYLALFVVTAFGAYGLISYSAPSWILCGFLGFCFAVLVAILMFSSALDSIYKVVVYEYSDLGESESGFSPELLARSMGR